MFITQKHLPRRTFLRGAGTALALPLLDAMVPALRAERKTAAAPVRRLGFLFYPLGVDRDRWRPTGEGASYKLSPAQVAGWNDVGTSASFRAGQQVVLHLPARNVARTQVGVGTRNVKQVSTRASAKTAPQRTVAKKKKKPAEPR